MSIEYRIEEKWQLYIKKRKESLLERKRRAERLLDFRDNQETRELCRNQLALVSHELEELSTHPTDNDPPDCDEILSADEFPPSTPVKHPNLLQYRFDPAEIERLTELLKASCGDMFDLSFGVNRVVRNDNAQEKDLGFTVRTSSKHRLSKLPTVVRITDREWPIYWESN